MFYFNGKDLPPYGTSVYDPDTGSFLGVYLERLTDPDIGGEERIIKNKSSSYIKGHNETKTFFFDIRKVFTLGLRGPTIIQVLINYLGSPAWINVNERDLIFN